MDVRYPNPPPGDDGDAADGPPPPPFVRDRRRRRRRRWLIVAALSAGLLILAMPAAMVGGWLVLQDGPAPDAAATPGDGNGAEDSDRSDDSGNGADAPGDDADDGTDDGDGRSSGADRETNGTDANGGPGARPDREVPPEQQIGAPDLDRLDADERSIGELLLDIDAAERAMLHYQEQVGEALTGDLDIDDPEELTGAVSEVARTGLRDLGTLRSRLQREQQDAAVDAVRLAYLGHLEAWVSYLEAVEDDPQILFRDLTRFDIDINRTGDDFVRAVDRLIETDLDADLGRYLEAIVARGFSGPETPQV